MDERRIQQVLEIEKQAQGIHDSAVKEADQLPRQADKDAQGIIEKARAESDEEARRIIAQARSEDESARIQSEAEEDARRIEGLARTNFDRTVSYLICRVVGRE